MAFLADTLFASMATRSTISVWRSGAQVFMFIHMQPLSGRGCSVLFRRRH